MDGSAVRQKTYAVNEEEQEFEAEGVEITVYGALIYLGCGFSELKALDVSKNTAMTKLECGGNQLTSLDIRKNTALTELYCTENQLKALDISKNTALTELNCDDNQLTSLDVSKDVAITSLNLERNQITILDVSKNVALSWLYCSGNPTVTTLSIASAYGDASVSEALAKLITDATSTTGTLNIYGGDNTTVHTAATTKGWTVNANL